MTLPISKSSIVNQCLAKYGEFPCIYTIVCIGVNENDKIRIIKYSREINLRFTNNIALSQSTNSVEDLLNTNFRQG